MIDNTSFYTNNKQPKQNESESFSKVLVITSGIVSLISVLVLIALNIANLSVLIGDKSSYGGSNDQISLIRKDLGSITNTIFTNVNPRLNIITSATTYSLPTLINSQVRNIRNDIYQYCTPKYDSPSGTCPINPNPKHEGQFMLIDPDITPMCNASLTYFKSINTFDFIPYASFIPSPTLPSGCVRIPTFSLSETIYSYSHNILHTSCADSSKSSQYWSIGKIVPGQNNTPVFNELVNWYLNDGKNRKSCVTVAGEHGAWLGCNIVTMNERDDYNTPGIMEIFIGYMDVFGKKLGWYYPSGSFDADHTYNALYFAVGSGIIKDGKVHFLMYGGLSSPLEGNAYCSSPECSSFDQNICNNAQKPSWFGRRQVLNSILTFDDIVSSKPIIKLRTIPPTQVTIGAEGRLYYYPHMNKTFIYLRSSTWHSLLQFGEINLDEPINITWYPYVTYTRPSADPCSSANRCPKECLGGVYTDFYLLSSQDKLGISVMLTGGKLRRGPQIKIADTSRSYFVKNIVSPNQEAWYTTTTCFLYYNVPWCISIVEMKPGAVGLMEPISFMYPLWSTCANYLDIWDISERE